MGDGTGTFNDLADEPKDKLRGGRGVTPKGPQRRYKRKPDRADKPFRKTTKAQEEKFQAIYAWNSNLISLTDLKALFRVVSVVAEKEYTNPRQQEVVLKTRDRLEKIKRLTETRDAAKMRLELKYNKRKALPSTRAETIAQFTTNHKGKLPHSWKRYPAMENKSGRVNQSRPGSSSGKILPPTYRGFRKFNKDFDALANALRKLLELDAKNKGRVRDVLRRVRKGVGVGVDTGGR